MWYIEKVLKLYFPEQHLLPCADFVLNDGKQSLTVKGWLPCHQTNIAYNLEIRRDRILNIIDLHIDKSKKNNKNKIITETARKMKSKGFACASLTPDQYKELATSAYTSIALWTCCVLYSHWELRKMNLDNIFKLLVDNIEALILPDSQASRPKFLFQPLDQTKVLIQRALQQMGELPYQDWDGFAERRLWHIRMHSDTGSFKKPGPHIRCLERYKNIWTTTYLIEEAKALAMYYRADNVTLIEGSPCKDIIPEDALVVCRTLEDAYKWKCEVSHGQLYIMSVTFNKDRLKELGVAEVQVLPRNACIYMPWAHLWGQRDWLKLAEFSPQHITCIGRLDQWAPRRGQVFRDMLTSNKFDTSRGYHAAADNVIEMQTENIAGTVSKIQERHKVIQCFSEKKMPNIDCGRRWLTKPKRIRTLRPSDTRDVLLFEERKIHSTDRETGNASVLNVRNYSGLRVPAVVYICTEDTTPFHVHVARTIARDALYILNRKKGLFSMKKQAPPKCTINPFT